MTSGIAMEDFDAAKTLDVKLKKDLQIKNGAGAHLRIR